MFCFNITPIKEKLLIKLFKLFPSDYGICYIDIIYNKSVV
jgi:hypothetical protein